MNIITGKRQHAETELADGVGGGTLSRRGVLGGLAALPVLYGVGSAARAAAGPAVRPGAAGAAAGGDLVRGAERRYNAPLLTPGTRLVLPAGVTAVPVLDYYHDASYTPSGSRTPKAVCRSWTTSVSCATASSR